MRALAMNRNDQGRPEYLIQICKLTLARVTRGMQRLSRFVGGKHRNTAGAKTLDEPCHGGLVTGNGFRRENDRIARVQ